MSINSAGQAGAATNPPESVYAPAEERICFDLRRHGAALLVPFLRCGALAVAGLFLLAMPWPLLLGAPVLLVVAAVGACSAVWRWDRTRFVVTTQKVFLVEGVVRKRAAAVRVQSLRSISLEQSFPGRLFGYGTLQAGPLHVEYVPHARRVRDVVEQLAG